MAKKKKPTFFEFMTSFPHEDEARKALARDMEAYAEKYPELRAIDSLPDMMMVLHQRIRDPEPVAAITGSLWCEYCFLCDHPF